MNTKSRSFKILLIIVGISFLIFSFIDLKSTAKLEEYNRQKIDSISSQINSANEKIGKIDSSIRKFGFKISGDSIIKLNNTFVDNSTTNVKSENQKGGQTAGTINNN